MEQSNTGIATTKAGLQSVDLDSGNLPNLEDAQVLPISLNFDYWTPERAGDVKRLFFLEVRPEKVKSINSDGEETLDCAIFIERTTDGTIKQIGNASKRLVGPLLDNVDKGYVKKGTPLQITFLGKVKNKTNTFISDNWSILPLLVNI